MKRRTLAPFWRRIATWVDGIWFRDPSRGVIAV